MYLNSFKFESMEISIIHMLDKSLILKISQDLRIQFDFYSFYVKIEIICPKTFPQIYKYESMQLMLLPKFPLRFDNVKSRPSATCI